MDLPNVAKFLNIPPDLHCGKKPCYVLICQCTCSVACDTPVRKSWCHHSLFPSGGRLSDMEATVVCFDNSEYTRNGDYTPTRAQAQADAINLLAGAKTQDNPENTVGVLTMAGKSPRVLVTPTPDLGKILSSMQVSGE